MKNEEVVEVRRRKSASSSAEDQENFYELSLGLEPATPGLMYWVLSHCAM